MRHRIIEVCCGSMADVISARDGGAHRVELCSAISEGGLTPSAGLIVAAVRERGEMRVNVLIRPRSGNFVYTTRELAIMEADIAAARAAGADGVVIGVLTPQGDVDMVAMQRLLKHCEGMDVTFHRAFDETADPLQAMEQIIALGIPRILTSGAEATAIQGITLLSKLVEKAEGRISIMPGAGITPSNILEIERLSGAHEFHSTCTDKELEPPYRSSLFGAAPRPTNIRIVNSLCSCH